MATSIKWGVWYDGKAGGKAGWCGEDHGPGKDLFDSPNDAAETVWFKHCDTPIEHYSIRVYTGNVK